MKPTAKPTVKPTVKFIARFRLFLGHQFFKGIIYSLAFLQRREWFLKILGVHPLRRKAFARIYGAQATQRPQDLLSGSTLLFHAASLGELEMLQPLIQFSLQQSLKIVVTVFSVSALKALDDLKPQVHWAGLSPAEDQWENFLRQQQVSRAFTAKYEAWPGFWYALSSLNIPLVLIEAKMRPSLKWIHFLFKFTNVKVPKLSLTGNHEQEREALIQIFKQAAWIDLDDPRWLRVHDRLQSPKMKSLNRLKNLVEGYTPIIMGSVWLEDLKFIIPAYQNYSKPAQVVILFPHDISPSNLSKLQRYLEEQTKTKPKLFSSATQLDPHDFLLVDEIGFLAESYALAKWIWVGGGFTHGVHSTLEASFSGAPMGCGPKNAFLVNETQEFVRLGWLRVLNQANELESFFDWVCSSHDPIEARYSWIATRVSRLQKGITKLFDDFKQSKVE